MSNSKSSQNVGLTRNTVDKYYTNTKMAEMCFNIFKKNTKPKKTDLCIEPSAGNGSFIKYIKKFFKHFIFLDLEPEHPDIQKQDYLSFELPEQFHKNKNQKIHLLGNPPFGRQSSLAIKFIKQSAKYCDTISFILPKSFKKDSLKKHFPLNFHPIYEYDMPIDSFVVNELPYKVPCVFQVWVKKNTQRKVPKKLFPYKYTFVKKEKPHDISFRRVGGTAGTIDRNTNDKSPQSHHFMKFEDNLLTDELFEKIKNINFKNKYNTVGPLSISKQELIREFNLIIHKE